MKRTKQFLSKAFAFATLFLLSLALTACPGGDEPETEPVPDPSGEMLSLKGYFLNLLDEDDELLLCVDHKAQPDIEITNARDGLVDYEDYPPGYSYQWNEDRTAKYNVMFRIKKDKNSTEYIKLIYRTTLRFSDTDLTTGTFSGTLTIEADGRTGEDKIEGTFQLTTKSPSFEEDEDEDEDEDEGQDDGQINVNISKPEFSEITGTSFTVKGTILADKMFTERGICYSGKPNPTVSDKVVKSNSHVAHATITGLYNGTDYYVRLYGIYNNVVYYGEEASVKTTGVRISKISLEQTVWSPYAVRLKATLPNEVGSYGLCWGKNPHPKITDSFSDEANRQTTWDLTKLQSNTTYYVRAYHISGPQIIYYEDSEMEIKTIGAGSGMPYFEANVNLSHWYSSGPNASATITYRNLPAETFNVKVRGGVFYGDYSYLIWGYEFSSYAEGPSGSRTFSTDKATDHSRIEPYYVRFKSVDTGKVYYIFYTSTYNQWEKYDHTGRTSSGDNCNVVLN